MITGVYEHEPGTRDLSCRELSRGVTRSPPLSYAELQKLDDGTYISEVRKNQANAVLHVRETADKSWKIDLADAGEPTWISARFDRVKSVMGSDVTGPRTACGGVVGFIRAGRRSRRGLGGATTGSRRGTA